MGCCMSSEKSSTIEVLLDENGVAHRVAEGEGTHVIRSYPDKETKIERKTSKKTLEVSGIPRPDAVHYPRQYGMSTLFPSRKVRPGEPTEVVDLQEKDHNI
ncbi:hypothetical protein BY458DRAFT_552311 [Sporodiniella umbellata]|nr:hypothetical protein BY458DRAFT_552311 [Sporodiniella umbellata]